MLGDFRRLLRGQPLRVATVLPGERWALNSAVFLDGSIIQSYTPLSEAAARDVVIVPPGREKELSAALARHTSRAAIRIYRRIDRLGLVLRLIAYGFIALRLAPFLVLFTQALVLWGPPGDVWQELRRATLFYALLLIVSIVLPMILRWLLFAYLRR